MNIKDGIRSSWETACCPGAAIAIVKDGQISVFNLGIRDIDTKEPVTDQTIFDVASLTKPLISYVVLQLADQKLVNMDAALTKFAKPLLPQDPLETLITARHILSHTSGLPNLKGNTPLQIHFPPGSRFSYSSVGFMYLQRAIEAIMNESLEDLVKRLVFEPLGMASSSLVWKDTFESNAAIPHENGKRLGKHRPSHANASYSLQTTAADYALFIAAVLRGDRLTADTYQSWFKLVANVPKADALQLSAAAAELDTGVGFGLGWGLEPKYGTFFQWGKMDGARAFTMGSPILRSGLVMLTNGNTGLRLMRSVTESLLPCEHPAIRWLEACVTE